MVLHPDILVSDGNYINHSETLSVTVYATIVQYLDGVLPHSLIPFVGDDISIAISKHNKFLQALIRDDLVEVIECELL